MTKFEKAIGIILKSNYDEIKNIASITKVDYKEQGVQVGYNYIDEKYNTVYSSKFIYNSELIAFQLNQ